MLELIKTQIEKGPLDWNEALGHWSQVTDGLGNKIDEGILETVIALNLLGFPTDQSCEGHLTHGTAAPWVSFFHEDIWDLYQQAKERRDAFVDSYAQGKPDGILTVADCEALNDDEFAPFNASIVQAEELHAQALSPLIEHLTTFYAEHLPPYHSLLVLEADTPGMGSLVLQGAVLQPGRSQEERVKWLKCYQDEMSAFTGYLKDLLGVEGS